MFRPNSILKLSNIVKCQFSTSAINRRRLVTQKYPLKTEAGRYIKMYVADKNDKAELLNFFGTGFIADEPVNRALGKLTLFTLNFTFSVIGLLLKNF